MSEPRRSRFRFVDLVALILVVGACAAVLGPCLIQGRRPDRRSHCLNNQHQLSLALLHYEGINGQFPGYVNHLPAGKDVPAEGETKDVPVSWIVLLLPSLDNSALYKAWQTGDRQEAYMPVLLCPSHPPVRLSPTDTLTSYVVNCGKPGDGDRPCDGVFFNHTVDRTKRQHMTINYLTQHDGATYTLLLSENVQAGAWTDTAEADLGMVWRDKPDKCSPINQCLDVGDRPHDLRYARPSSHHGNGVVVSFCDGHQEFLRDDIDYEVYKHLMTPNSREAGMTTVFDPSQF